MKIAMYNLTTTVKTGGIETFNWEVGKELAHRGHEVHIYGGQGSFQRPHSLTVYTYPFRDRESYPNLGTRFRKMAERWSMARRAASDLIERGYDVIYISKPYDLPWAIRVAKRLCARCFFSSGGTEFFPGYGFLVRRLSLFTACSHYNAREIESRYGIRPIVLYNGVNIDMFKPMAEQFKIMRELGLRKESKILISVGRLRRVKGFEYVIEAVANLRGQFPNLYYLVAGDGDYKDYLKSYVRSLGLEDRVIFLGNISHSLLPQYFSLATIAVFPSIHSETFGMAAAEAMACGVPVVATSIGGIPEVVGEAGKLCPPRDAEALAESLRWLLLNPNIAEDLGEKGQQRIKENFTWKVAVDTIEQRGIYGEHSVSGA